MSDQLTGAQESAISRRNALTAGLVGAAGLAAACASPAQESASEPPRPGADPGGVQAGTSSGRMPVVYLPHGGGPWNIVDVGMSPEDKESLSGYLRSVATFPKSAPKAIVIVSAHWEEPVPTVMTAARPPMLYDYYGFPPESYKIVWPAPGEPRVAARVQEVLENAGIKTAADSARGFDHGTFVPLMVTYPNAEVSTVQLSLKRGLDPTEHLAIGRALAPLRDEGILILGSGMSFHNMRSFFSRTGTDASKVFDDWLAQTMALAPDERDARLAAWSRAPHARTCHPREEHLLPLMVMAGAAGTDRGVAAYRGSIWGFAISAFHFG